MRVEQLVRLVPGEDDDGDEGQQDSGLRDRVGVSGRARVRGGRGRTAMAAVTMISMSCELSVNSCTDSLKVTRQNTNAASATQATIEYPA